MKTLLLTLTALALFSVPSFAETVPSTFDPGCNVNFINGGCGEKPGNGGDGADPVSVAAPTPTPTPCPPKETKS